MIFLGGEGVALFLLRSDDDQTMIRGSNSDLQAVDWLITPEVRISAMYTTPPRMAPPSV